MDEYESLMSAIFSRSNAMAIKSMTLYREYIESGLPQEYARNKVLEHLQAAIDAFCKSAQE
jgi:hypothetical protein